MKGFVIAVCLVLVDARIATNNADLTLCGSRSSLELDESGEGSSVTLRPGKRRNSSEPCYMEISAPKSHLVHLQFADTDLMLYKAMGLSTPQYAPCVLQVFLPENKDIPVWQGDLCTLHDLPPVDLLTSRVTLSWEPGMSLLEIGREIGLTAVGTGNACKAAGQHVCMRIGWEPSMCVSEHLVCNGRQECPKGSTTPDEGDELCRDFHLQSWRDVAVGIIKQLPEQTLNDKWLQNIIQQQEKSTQQLGGLKAPAQDPPWDELNRILARQREEREQYRPDFQPSHKPESSAYSPSLLPGCILVSLVISLLCLFTWWQRKRLVNLDGDDVSDGASPGDPRQPYGDAVVSMPPDYDDLDLPPSYTLLFPDNNKATVVVGEALEMTELTGETSGS